MAEQTLIIGAENNLVATLNKPDPLGAKPAGWAAILSNAGVIPRIGPHRMNVRLAGSFATMGIPSIRFDLSGLGDSRRSSSSLPTEEQWIADTRAAIDAAQSHLGCERFFMVGFCSGAEVAHRVALEDRRLRAAVLWDWYSRPTYLSTLRATLFRLQRVGPGRALQRLFARARREPEGMTMESPDRVPDEPALSHGEYVGRIQALVDDGVELLFAYSGGEFEQFNHRGQFRSMFRGCDFLDKVSFEYLEIADHLVTRSEAQRAFTEMVVSWLQRRLLVAR